ncbi:MAG: alpha/beta fold hydrolase, partial [Alphaproteobacteria bacterium]|nr:alpha/beta fold hydrolase [Alphaproteobacteria bacterium]
PGGSFKAKHAQIFDLKKYRVIGFDQRGCGKSLPAGQWNHNTANDIVKDADRLLKELKIFDKVIVCGASWGATMALKFAETFSKQIKAIIVTSVFMADDDSIKWEEEDCAYFYPDVLEKIKEGVSEWETIPVYYAGLICSGEYSKQQQAISKYGMYERLRSSLNPKFRLLDVTEECLAENRIYTTYAAKKFYLKENEIIKNVKKIAKIPTLIVHNRLDFVCPIKGAYLLYKAMSNAKLVVVPDSGHVSKLLRKTIKIEVKEFLKHIHM